MSAPEIDIIVLFRDRTGSGSRPGFFWVFLVFFWFWFFLVLVFSGFLDQKKPENQVFKKPEPDPEPGLLDLVFSGFFLLSEISKISKQNFIFQTFLTKNWSIFFRNRSQILKIFSGGPCRDRRHPPPMQKFAIEIKPIFLPAFFDEKWLAKQRKCINT